MTVATAETMLTPAMSCTSEGMFMKFIPVTNEPQMVRNPGTPKATQGIRVWLACRSSASAK